MRKLFVLGAALLAISASATALGQLTTNTVDPQATLAREGERAKVTVLLGCDRAQQARLRVTLVQGSEQNEDRAWGRGKKKVGCETKPGEFRVRVEAREEARFDAGRATACVLALTSDDARQWCKEVKLRVG